ncbi:hypothetical protein [Piscinibacter sakaiensis]|uniref:DUF7931 domain-containing protein n=1 Tax=Piscinibacter sakaiensis TaxID=1547922 RepID=UPI003AACB04A
MDSETPAAPTGPSPASVSFLTRGDFRAAFRQAIAHLAEHGCREIYLCDRDYADWPLGEPEVVDLLTRWAMPHRKLVVLAARFETLQRQHPRWVAWRRTWSHIVDCRQVADDDVPAIPSMMIAPGQLSLRVHDPIHFRGRLAFTRPEEVRDWEELDAFLQRSAESFPVTQLGL